MRSPSEVLERIRERGREAAAVEDARSFEFADSERGERAPAESRGGVGEAPYHCSESGLMLHGCSPDIDVADADTEEAAADYAQWCDVDPERFLLERRAMDELGFSCGKLRDGRICFLRDSEDGEGLGLAVICDWLHPLKPPSVFAEGEDAVLRRIPKLLDGSLDLLSSTAVWDPKLAAATMVAWFETRVDILRAAASQTADTKE